MRTLKKLTAAVFCLSGILLAGCSNEPDILQSSGTNLSGEITTEPPEEATAAPQTQEQLVLGDLSNLDVSEIAADIPLPEHLYNMESKGEGKTWTDEKVYEEFPKLIEAYGGPKAEELDPDKEIYFETWLEGIESHILVSERDKEPMDWCIEYYSDSLYLSMTEVRQIGLLHPDVMERITGETWDRAGEWIVDENADPIAVYYMGEDDTEGVSYQLDGEEVALDDAVAFIENTLKDNENLPCISTPGFEYRVSYVEVYQFGKNHAYHFFVHLYYQGVRLDTNMSGPVENTEGNNVVYVSNLNKYTMYRKDEINAVHMFDWLNETQDSIVEAEPTIDYEKALQILSGYLSDTHTFKVLNSELVYSFHIEYKGSHRENGTNHITPCWLFELSTAGIQQYSKIFILINVETGEVVQNAY